MSAQDAVLRDNLFGLELDPRCVQIAMFAVALAGMESRWWMARAAGAEHRLLGDPGKASVGGMESTRRAATALENALSAPHPLRDADTLGSLIDPSGVEIS